MAMVRARRGASYLLTERLLLEEQEDGVKKLKVLGEVVQLWRRHVSK